ncbi:hypothetical protein AMPC_23410 [Anaeromyxobacter paludicola]|uniref:Uncharacterized protein n=1 Tax=Anaeromyxobacter paludicola TaxID=2918171 RepID=A0ABN6NAB1_9BACT|nr:hypothetical protein AMPC_23410 [Anaeromyxobacter paludicola]
MNGEALHAADHSRYLDSPAILARSTQPLGDSAHGCGWCPILGRRTPRLEAPALPPAAVSSRQAQGEESEVRSRGPRIGSLGRGAPDSRRRPCLPRRSARARREGRSPKSGREVRGSVLSVGAPRASREGRSPKSGREVRGSVLSVGAPRIGSLGRGRQVRSRGPRIGSLGRGAPTPRLEAPALPPAAVSSRQARGEESEVRSRGPRIGSLGRGAGSLGRGVREVRGSVLSVGTPERSADRFSRSGRPPRPAETRGPREQHRSRGPRSLLRARQDGARRRSAQTTTGAPS